MQLHYQFHNADLNLNIDGISIIVTRNINAKADLILLTRPHLRTLTPPINVISTSQIGQIVGFDGLNYNQTFKYKSLKIRAESTALYWANFFISYGDQEIAIINSTITETWMRYFKFKSCDYLFDNTDMMNPGTPNNKIVTQQGSPDTKFQAIAINMVKTLKSQEIVFFRCELDDLMNTCDMVITMLESTNMMMPIYLVGLDLLDLLMRPLRADTLKKKLQDKMLLGKYPFKFMEYIEDKRIRILSNNDLGQLRGGMVVISLLALNFDCKVKYEVGTDFKFERKLVGIMNYGESIISRSVGKWELELRDSTEMWIDASVLDFKVEKNYVTYTLESDPTKTKRLKLQDQSSVSVDMLL